MMNSNRVTDEITGLFHPKQRPGQTDELFFSSKFEAQCGFKYDGVHQVWIQVCINEFLGVLMAGGGAKGGPEFLPSPSPVGSARCGCRGAGSWAWPLVCANPPLIPASHHSTLPRSSVISLPYIPSHLPPLLRPLRLLSGHSPFSRLPSQQPAG
jgi:hypothetical protein